MHAVTEIQPDLNGHAHELEPSPTPDNWLLHPSSLASVLNEQRFTEYTDKELEPPTRTHTPDSFGVCAADVPPEGVEWTWDGRIPKGHLSILQGDPDLGKSLIVLDIIARISRGDPMPNSAAPRVAPCRSLIITAEDTPADTIVPRLIAAGADLSMVRIVMPSVFSSLTNEDQFAALAKYATAHDGVGDLGLIFFDPLAAYFGNANFHNMAEARRVLTPVCELAYQCGAAIVSAGHLTKDTDRTAIARGQGSMGITAAARSVLQVTRDPDDPHRRIMLPVKANLTPIRTGYAFRIEAIPVKLHDGSTMDYPRIEWEPGDINMTADDALGYAPGKTGRPPSEIEYAKTFLRENLEQVGGSAFAKEIKRWAEAAHISDRTLDRAKSDLYITTDQGGSRFAASIWTLPPGITDPDRRANTQGLTYGVPSGNANTTERQKSGPFPDHEISPAVGGELAANPNPRKDAT